MTSPRPATGEAEPRVIDLMHLGRARAIGAWRVGEVLIDPGPASCLGALMDDLEADPPRVLALTHIHLDHAGASGTLMQRFPELELWVHERGARHMADPGRLLASAGRLYGDQMDRLWGEMLPVPEHRVRVLKGGERLGGLRVAYTPGHASHHVSYLHEPTGWAFTGDVTGVRIGGGPTIAPTPPPDIDLPAWRDSVGLIAQWQPAALAITHFGGYRDVDRQLSELLGYLDDAEAMAGALDSKRFAGEMHARISAAGTEVANTYAHAMPSEQSYAGMARYLSRRDGQQ